MARGSSGLDSWRRNMSLAVATDTDSGVGWEAAGRIDVFHELLSTLAGVLDVRDVFQRLSVVAARVIPHDEADLALLTEDGAHFRLYASTWPGEPEVLCPGEHCALRPAFAISSRLCASARIVSATAQTLRRAATKRSVNCSINREIRPTDPSHARGSIVALWWPWGPERRLVDRRVNGPRGPQCPQVSGDVGDQYGR